MGSYMLCAVRQYVVMATVLLVCSVSYAEIIWDLENRSSPVPTIAAVNEAGGLVVGDKLFADFVVTSSGNSPFRPTAADIMISGLLSSDGDYGVKFNGAWFAMAQQVLDTTITFDVSVLPTSQDLIKDNTLGMTAVGVNAESPDAFVLMTENVYSAPPPQENSIADKLVFKTTQAEKLVDHQDFQDPNGKPVAYSKVWVVKDITLFGGTGKSGTIGAALSEFTQTFSQVPEPQSLVLLLCALPGLGLFMWRRCRSRW